MRLIAFATIALWAGAAQAAVIHIKPELDSVFDSQWNDVKSTVVVSNEMGGVSLSPSDARYTMKINFSFTISDLRPNQQGFGNIAFSIHMDGNLKSSSIVPEWNMWMGIGKDVHGPPPGAVDDKWSDHGDYGIPGDLQDIVVGIDPNDFGPIGDDPRRELGQHVAEYFGIIYVELPGAHGTTGSLSIEGDGGSVYDANNKLVADGVTVTGGSIDFRVVPEPRSAILLGLGGMLLAVVGRRWHVRPQVGVRLKTK